LAEVADGVTYVKANASRIPTKKFPPDHVYTPIKETSKEVNEYLAISAMASPK
jgi:hypothetical protein